jgi:hypothetical protein
LLPSFFPNIFGYPCLYSAAPKQKPHLLFKKWVLVGLPHGRLSVLKAFVVRSSFRPASPGFKRGSRTGAESFGDQRLPTNGYSLYLYEAKLKRLT